MKKVIKKANLFGSVSAIESKSMAHRLLIAAALSDSPTDIYIKNLSEDILATINCLKALGADIDVGENGLHVWPLDKGDIRGERILECAESGSTLRFLLPVAAALGKEARFMTRGRLFERPLSPLIEELKAHGARVIKNKDRSLSVSGRLSDPHFSIAANISSQFISGLLFAIPLMGKSGSITLTEAVESSAYIAMTIDALSKFGVSVTGLPEREGSAEKEPKLSVKGSYVSPGAVRVEGDWSNAAFWLVASKLTNKAVIVTGLDMDSPSLQGDSVVTKLIEDIAKGGAVIDCSQTPDLLPVLSVLSALTPGETRFINASRLRLKESDRIASSAEMIRALGGIADETPDGIVVKGVRRLRGGNIDSHNDHRIAMSAAIASIACDSEVVINGAEAVGKSYPRFWDDFISLGGITEEG